MIKSSSKSLNVLKDSDDSLETSLLDNPTFQWILQKRKEIGYSVLILLAVSTLAYRFLAHQSEKAEQNYMEASKTAAMLAASPENQKALETLETLLINHKDLQSKYDGTIAQYLLSEDQPEKALPYVERTFARVQGETPPYYLDYSKGSLDIAEGKLAEALKGAYALKEKMLSDLKLAEAPMFGGTLYAFNLLRIAFIEKAVNNKEGELAAWKELKEMGKPTHPVKISSQDLERVMSHFNDQGAELKNYIN